MTALTQPPVVLTPRMAQEGLILSVTEEIWRQMNLRKVSPIFLAAILGCGKSHVSQLLNGGHNMTLRTLSDIAEALHCNVQIKITRKKE